MALVIMLVLVAMGVLYLVVNGASTVGMKLGRSNATQTALLRAKEALIGYAATYRDDPANVVEVFGYLPCPDMTPVPNPGPTPPAQGNGVAESGCEATGVTVAGLLPYRTLGLEDLRDSEGICLWYIVSGNFKNSPKAGMLNWDTQGEIQLEDSNGNVILAPEDITGSGGAAAVIIASRAPLGNQARTPNPDNVCGALPDEVAAYIESPINAGGVTVITQGDVHTNGDITNNDRVIAITPKEIFDRIVSRNDFRNPLSALPNGNINVLTDRIRGTLEAQLWPSIMSGTAHPMTVRPSNPGYTQAPARYVGDLPSSPPFTVADTDYVNYLENWRDQYRYTLCSSTTMPGCVTINGDMCYGAVLFSGRTIYHQTPPPYLTPTGNACHGTVPLNDGVASLRPSNQKPPPTAPATYTDLLANYFENALPLLDGSASTFTGNDRYDAGNPAADVAACLINKATIRSFATDIGTLSPVASNAAYPLVSVNTGTQTVTLGNISGSGPGALAGCVWFQDALRFSTSLRVYFEFVIQDAGQGFTFAIADAARNGNTVPGCGAAGDALGYSGASVGSGIVFPKIGLEIDTASQTSTRRDPGSHHAAFVFWGSTTTNSDDNTHNAGVGTATEPLNPHSLSSPRERMILGAQWAGGIVTVTVPPPSNTSFRFESNQNVRISGINPTGYNGTFPITVIDDTHFSYPLTANPGTASITTARARATFRPGIAQVSTSHLVPPIPPSFSVPPRTILIRLDISKRYTAPLGLYTMKAYIADTNRLGPNAATGSYSPTCTADNLRNVFLNLEDICEQNSLIERNDLPVMDIDGEALANVYLGFTNGQSSNSGAGNQSIVITNFIGSSQ